MANPQLRLVQDAPEPQGRTTDPVRRVFEHWAWMMGKSLRRTKLGPTRRAAIAADGQSLRQHDAGELQWRQPAICTTTEAHHAHADRCDR